MVTKPAEVLVDRSSHSVVGKLSRGPDPDPYYVPFSPQVPPGVTLKRNKKFTILKSRIYQYTAQ